MSHFDVSLKIPLPYHDLGAQVAFVEVGMGSRGLVLEVQSNVFVEVTWIPKGTVTKFAFQRFKSRVSANVDLQAIFPRIQLPAVDAQMPLFGGSHVGDNRL